MSYHGFRTEVSFIDCLSIVGSVSSVVALLLVLLDALTLATAFPIIMGVLASIAIGALLLKFAFYFNREYIYELNWAFKLILSLLYLLVALIIISFVGSWFYFLSVWCIDIVISILK